MKVSGRATLNARAEQVFAALNDPAVLVRTIPGCEQLEALGDDRYRMIITAGVASIKGTYLGDVALADPVPPSAFTLRANGSGTPGTVSADVRVSLDDNGDGTTLLRYDADAVVGGPVGGVGQRVLTGVARRTAGEFFDAVNALLAGTEPVSELAGTVTQPGVEPVAAPAGTQPGVARPVAEPATAPAAPAAAPAAPAAAPAAGQVFRRPPGTAPSPGQVSLRDQLPGVLIGAVVALLGVIVGWRLARAARREG